MHWVVGTVVALGLAFGSGCGNKKSDRSDESAAKQKPTNQRNGVKPNEAPAPKAPGDKLKPEDKAAKSGPRCPNDAALAKTLREVWKTNAKEFVVPIKCQPVRVGGKPNAWVIYAWVETRHSDGEPDEATMRREVIHATDNKVIAALEPWKPAPWYRADGFFGSIRAADLDGDGTDEVLVDSQMAHGGTSDTMFYVYRIASPELKQIAKMQIGYDDAAAQENEADATSCVVSVKIGDADAKGERRLETKREPSSTSPTCVKDQVLRLVGDKLVPVK